MQRVLYVVLLALSIAATVQAQETTGPVAEQTREEVMQFEKEKVPLLLKGGAAFADFFDRVDADDVVMINGNGSTITKAAHVANWRAGGQKMLSNDQHDHHLYVYDNGNVAVVTYVGTTTDERNGKISTNTVRCADTWIKQDGKWLRIVHANTDIQPAGDQAAEQTMLQADHTFITAVSDVDTQAVAELLDADFSWTDSEGKTEKKSELLANLPKARIANESSAISKHYIYGDIGDVQVNLGRMHALRVWVKRPVGWRIIVYQEVKSLDNSPSATPGTGKCENPCKSVSYQPRNEMERQVISAYEHLETAAMTHNSHVFSTLVADEFVAASSNSNKIYDKRGRMDDFDHSKMAGVAPTPLFSARMFDFGDAALMISFHRPDSGRPIHVTRIWVKRNGNWVETLSYQTAIQTASQLRE